METIDYKKFLGVANINNGKNQIKARVLDVDANNSKALVETVDGSMRIKLNNKTGELLSVGDYVVVEYDKLLTKKNAYISLRNGQANPATKVNIENAIVIQEKVASYLLHEYTVVDYVAGNKIVYGGTTNPVIINGYRAERDHYYGDLYPEIHFPKMDYKNMPFTDVSLKLSIEKFLDNGSISVSFIFSGCDTKGTFSGNAGTYYTTKETYTTTDYSQTGICLSYRYIYPPNEDFEHGYMEGNIYFCYINTSGGIVRVRFSNNIVKIGFSSKAEYNAAVGLISEPMPYSMYQVNETITEA